MEEALEPTHMTRSPSSRRSGGVPLLIVGLVLAGCTSAGTSPSLGPSTSASASASAGESASASEAPSAAPSLVATAVPSEPTDSLPPFACSPSVSIPATAPRAQITDVRVGTHTGYDRVTFEFAAGIPQTTIEGVLPPFFADPSGLPLDVAGTAFLKVTMNGGTKVSPSGGITYAGPTNFEPGFDRLVQLREGGDFEALSTWYLGLDGGSCFRILTLAGPSRLVIDIEH
jgi:hypothetical protein